MNLTSTQKKNLEEVRRMLTSIHQDLEDVLEPHYTSTMDFVEAELIFTYLMKLGDALYLLDQTLKEFRPGRKSR